MQPCKRFSNRVPQQSCFGNIEVGREYVCPQVGSSAGIPEQEPSTWLAEQNSRNNVYCHGASGNIGRHILCNVADVPMSGMTGGGDSPFQLGDEGIPAGTDGCDGRGKQRIKREKHHKFRQFGHRGNYKYSADGTIVKTPCDCGCLQSMEDRWGQERAGGCQRGGAPASEVYHPQESSYPRDTCGCRQSTNCGYVKYDSYRQYGNIDREIPGVYYDLTAASIGNRPVHGEADNGMKFPKGLSLGMTPTPTGIVQTGGAAALSHMDRQDAISFLDRQFDCMQPFWCKPCM